MDPFKNPLFSFLLFIGFVTLMAALVNFRQERAKAKLASLSPFELALHKGFIGTEEEWMASLPRKERRAIQFADLREDEVKARATASQKRYYAEFCSNVEDVVYDQSGAFIDNAKNILAIAEHEVMVYRQRAHKKDLAETHLSPLDLIIVQHACNAIVYMASRHRVKDLNCIAAELVKFVENTLRIRHLNGVLYRHKGTVNHSTRCGAMVKVIIGYFQPIWDLEKDGDYSGVPFDYVDEDHLLDSEELRRLFFANAIDKAYAVIMKDAERNSYDKVERLRNKEHEHNRKQRKRRVARSKTRN